MRRVLFRLHHAIFKIVRYFLRPHHPPVSSILLVESGARNIVERVIPVLRRGYGADIRVDLVSCYASLPKGFDAQTTRIFRVSDYRGSEGRRKLYRELRGNGYSIMGIVCSGEPLMTKWKAALAFQIPAKTFVINENGDISGWTVSTSSSSVSLYFCAPDWPALERCARWREPSCFRSLYFICYCMRRSCMPAGPYAEANS